MINYADLIERLERWSDTYHKCIWCGQYERACSCARCHQPEHWSPTLESNVFDEAREALKKLLNFANQACCKCDDCGALLLEGGIVESDGLHGKPARIVCPTCRAKNPQVCDPFNLDAAKASYVKASTQNWVESLREDKGLPKVNGVGSACREHSTIFEGSKHEVSHETDHSESGQEQK